MAKFLNYEDRLEIESGLKEHMTFTELGEKLGRDRTTITKEIRNYSIEQDTGYGSYPHNTCKYRKACKRKKVCGTNAVSYTHLDVYKRQDDGFIGGNKKLLIELVLVSMVIYTINSLIDIVKEKKRVDISAKIQYFLSEQSFSHLMKLRVNYFNNTCLLYTSRCV